jgi:response regulator RpfG family c-di-GMP phosphodiesterase
MRILEELSAAQLIMTAIAAFSGFMIWRLQRKIQKRDEAREKAELEKQAELSRQKRDVQQYQRFMVQTQRTLTKLCVATAVAVRDGKCNGEMTTALEIMEVVAREQRDFLVDQGINGLF